MEYPCGDCELRNAIACDWPRFLELALPDLRYVFLPNMGGTVIHYAERLGVNALLLTGGDDWGIFPERDDTECRLFDWARVQDFPVLGICRGAQVINRLMGGKTSPRKGHVFTRHEIELHGKGLPKGAIVNSFHSHCVAQNDLAPGLEIFALAPDGSVEGFYGAQEKICGIIWHPEREKQPSALDITLMRDLCRGNFHVGK